MFGKNIKVHFAGSDGEENFYAALNAADVHYRLYSCYKYIVNKKPDDDFTLPENHVIRAQCRDQTHVIQDSGLFTLMFGAGKGQKQTIETLTVWQDKLIEFVRQNHITASIVEIDCQKVLGVEEAWYFRERMKKLLPESRQINVFHFEDGIKGLDRLIEFSDYIAVSVPEWRIVKAASHKHDIRYITHYIKNKKPDIDIHLLGCTDYKIIKENNFCSTCDSTSWLSGVKYGYVNDGVKKEHINHFKKDIFEQRQREVVRELNSRNIEIKGKLLNYTTNASICATICKDLYARSAGPQD
ncbi:MAG: hypothetical protein LIO54_09435 [Oscillospiraceae bacterium]|nr:hypothetical protein [Oscillospiraceae bacterium]